MVSNIRGHINGVYKRSNQTEINELVDFINANKYELYATFTDQYNTDAINWRAHGIEINCTPLSDRGFTSGTEIILYKYVES